MEQIRVKLFFYFVEICIIAIIVYKMRFSHELNQEFVSERDVFYLRCSNFLSCINIAPIVVTTNKTTTTADVFSGMLHSVRQVIQDVQVTAVMAGTTHFINALIQRRNLAKVCTLRVCGPATHSLRPMATWPNDLRQQVKHDTYSVLSEIRDIV